MTNGESNGKRAWIFPLLALAWPVLLWGVGNAFVIGQRDAEMANLKQEVAALEAEVREHARMELGVWAAQRALDDKQQDLIEANRAERDSQVRALGEKIIYNTTRIDRDEVGATQLLGRVEVLEGLNNRDRPHR